MSPPTPREVPVPEPLRFYFDFISPYAWLVWTQLGGLAARHDRALSIRPVLFAGLLNHHGQLGPAEIPAKRAYTFRDVLRKAHRFGVPVEPPPAHPFNPLPALRAVEAAPPALRAAAVDALFRATWAGGGGVDGEQRVAEVLSAAGLDGPGLVARGAAPEVKQAVRLNTAEAIGLGVFGVPTVVVKGALFWGTDSLLDLEDFLQGHDVVPPDLEARWRNLPASAQRPR